MVYFKDGCTEVLFRADKVVSLEVRKNGMANTPWVLTVNLEDKYVYTFQCATREELDKLVKEIESKL